MLPSPDPSDRFLFHGHTGACFTEPFTSLLLNLPPPSLPTSALPSLQLFYLCTDVCQQTTAKDSRGLGKDIWNIFLDRNAVRAGLDCEPVQDSLSLQGISWKASI